MDTWRYKVQQARLHKKKVRGTWADNCGNRFVDCPVWPDSLGFRDVRLHRMNVDFNTMDWETPYTQMLAQNRFPLWIKLVYLVEKLPMPKKIKSIHSHINYTIAKVEK